MKIYSQMPFPLRGAAASLWGYYLCSWRYGSETERLVEETLARESWTHEQWKNWQRTRLLEVLRRAAGDVPYYRDYWSHEKSGSWERLENWPILTKEEIRKTPRAFISEKSRQERLYGEQTGGTTGTPLNLWFDKKAVRQWYGLFEARWRRWYGVSRNDRWAIIGGQQVAAGLKKAPFWVWNAGLRQLYISAYHLFPEVTGSCLDAMKHAKVRYLIGYTSAIHFLASEIIRQNFSPPSLKVIITNAEPFSSEQRAVIEKAFQCPVRETYGMSETVAAASECDHKSLHLWPEAGYLEVIDNKGSEVAPGEIGEFICTGFLNEAMPLIRYAVGDRGSKRDPAFENGCACGRGLPLLGAVQGRTHDIVTLKDGRQIWYFNPVFAGIPIREAQVIQEEPDIFRILISSERPLEESEEKIILERFQARAGSVSVNIESCPYIPRDKNGKFRAVIVKNSNTKPASDKKPNFL